MKLSKRISQLKPSSTLAITSKAKEMKTRGIDVVNLSAGEPDFDTPAEIKQAANIAIEKGFTKYTPASGIAELKEAICKKLKGDNNLAYTPEQIAVSCGAKHALYNIFQVLCNIGDEVLIISPYWVSYPEMIKLGGGTPRIVKTNERDSFVVEPKAIKQKLTKRTKAIVINSPSNPAGAVYGKDVLQEIAEIAVSKNISVVSDEIYEKLIYNGEEHVSIASLGKKIYDLAFTVNGVSKTYSMTGWRIGYVAGPRDIIKKIVALQSHSTSNPSSISQIAALHAITGDQQKVHEMVNTFASRRNVMVKGLNSLKGLSCVNPRGAFYVFCNIAETKLDSLTFANRLLDEAKVACVPGVGFGSDRHIRLSFAASTEHIKKGLDRIGQWLDKVKT